MKPRTESFWMMAAILGAVVCLAMPGSAWAAESTGGGWGSLLEIGKLFNLALVIAILIWIGRKPLANFFASRTQAIQEQLAEAQKTRQEAEVRLAEINARMSSLDAELQDIKASAEQEAQEEYQRLVAAAERDAQKIIDQARREIEGMTRAAQLELKAHVAELSVGLAKQKIRDEITNDDRDRLFARFVESLGGKE